MNSLLSLEGMRGGETFAPLARVTLHCEAEGTIIITDALGRVYFHQPACPTLECTLAGALGYHAIVLEDETGKMLDRLHIRVDASTSLQDEGGLFHELFQMLLYTMLTQGGADWGDSSFARYNGRIYSFFIRWLRDHVHVLKGMKYFSDQVKDGIDLYRDSQRDDGMIWDNVYPRTKQPNYWDVRFADGDFIRPFADYTAEFKRIPVEADVEYLFVEGLYFTWKATGDTGWLAASLDSAIRALEYSVSSPYRWSEKSQVSSVATRLTPGIFSPRRIAW